MAQATQKQSLNRIVAADKKGLTALVIELCEDRLHHFPEDQYALLWYAIAKTQLSQYAQAEKAIRRAIAIGRESRRFSALAFREMGRLCHAKGELGEATRWYRRALRADPKSDSYVHLGCEAFRKGQLKQAARYYQKAIAHPASCVDEAYFNLGGIRLAERRYPEAIACYRKAIEIDPDYAIARKCLKDAELALRFKSSSPKSPALRRRR